METLSQKTALITGGSKGIGYAIAEAMVAQNMQVVITSRNEQEVVAAAAELNEKGPGRALGVACDVRELASQQACVRQIMDTFGGLDVLIANAGIGHFASITEMTPEQWNDVIDINLTGVFYSVKAALEPLMAAPEGYIITIASLAGTNFFAQGTAYNASKFGLVGFTQAMMLDLRHEGINVSTIMPGSVATYFNDHVPTEADSWKIQPVDIAEVVIDLLQLPARTLPSKVEMRPARPPKR